MSRMIQRGTAVVAPVLKSQVTRFCFSHGKSYRLISETIYLNIKRIDEQKAFNQVAVLSALGCVGLYYSPYKELVPVALALIPLSLILGFVIKFTRKRLVRKIQYQPNKQILTFHTFDENTVVSVPLSSVTFKGFLGFDEECTVKAYIGNHDQVLGIAINSYIKLKEVQVSNKDFVEALFSNDLEEVKRYHS